ncbi:MAG TPA: hypothetical protein VL985_07090 [Stellaceae bacterium]|nr:hypothetical protein [Stellaceae bacterium]
MNKVSPKDRDGSQHRREKTTIDHLVDRVFDPESRDSRNRQQPSETESGDAVEEQVRREWDPKKDGGLPTF